MDKEWKKILREHREKHFLATLAADHYHPDEKLFLLSVTTNGNHFSSISFTREELQQVVTLAQAFLKEADPKGEYSCTLRGLHFPKTK